MNDLIEIIVYSTESGKYPFYEWLEDLDKRIMAKVSKRLLRLSMGNFGDCCLSWDFRRVSGSIFRKLRTRLYCY